MSVALVCVFCEHEHLPGKRCQEPGCDCPSGSHAATSPATSEAPHPDVKVIEDGVELLLKMFSAKSKQPTMDAIYVVTSIMKAALNAAGQREGSEGFGFGAGGVPAEEVCVMGLCEVPHVHLQPRVYRFIIMPGCEKCVKAAREATEMPGDETKAMPWEITGSTTPPAPAEAASREERPRIIETEDGPQDLGEHYEAIYGLADAIADGFDMEPGDALGVAIDATRRYELEPSTIEGGERTAREGSTSKDVWFRGASVGEASVEGVGESRPEKVQHADPEFLSRVVLYGLTRRSIYRHLREADDTAPAGAGR